MISFQVLSWSHRMWICTFNLPEKLQMQKVMSSDRMESVQGLNLRYMVCQFNTHQMEAPEQDVLVDFTARSHGDGPIVPIDTEKLLIEKQQCQADLPAQVASTSSMPPINRDVNHANGVVNVAGATGELLARKRKNQVEVPSQDTYDHANGVAYVSGAFVPADTENILFEKQRRQAALPPQDATIGFTAPITRVNHAYGVADVAGVTVPASTENLLYRNCRHRVEEPAQDACTGFTAPISRDVNHATGVAEVAGASADIEKLPFEKHRQYWEFAESFEACKKMPQNPHFRPLKFCKEIVREGQALARMVTYNNIVRKISNFNMDTKREEMMDELSLLEDLDAHGFNVQMLKDRLNKLLMFKSEEEKVKNMLEQKEKVLSIHVEESRIFNGTRAKREERVQELWKEVASIQKEEEYIDAKKANLQQVEEANNEKCGRINMQIEEHIASPLW
ncbi:uncharacterized protein LOC108224036 isoform X2 [Daucus carota subsp. sativus]|uniref:uncharacterized protein LOC108224036 isoform X2 n=1 Tax=Daucus carota subsp. sativus TaxID=79200 RepID=UPI003082FF3D